jgi:hypothetical protein
VTPFFAFASDAPHATAPAASAVKPSPKAPASPRNAAAATSTATATSTSEPVLIASTAQPVSLAPPAPSREGGVALAAPQPPRSQGQPGARPAGSPAAATKADSHESNGDDAHWREVYEAYIATRKQCGEPIDNLNFDKFGLTLRKTRDQIIDKQGVKTVRFSVQVKEGKAALKAQPIKR